MPFIGAAIGAIAGAIGAVGSFITGLGFIGKLALGIGLNLAASYLQRRKQERPEPTGVQIQTQYGADVPRQVAMGLVGIAGHECHVNAYGSDNKWLQDVYQVSDYYCSDLSRVAINGEWVTLDRNNPDPDKGWPVTSGDYAGVVWIKWYDGKQVAADAALVANAKPADRWTADCKGIGNAYVIVTAEFVRDKQLGRPDMFFEVKGAPLYDWRKDSTVGGSGAHRWNDVSTHEFTENPIVMDYNYRRGLSVNGDLFCGMEMDASDLPLDKFTSAANVCDETVEGEARYRCSIMMDCTATHGDNIEALMKSCGGVVIDAVDGSWPMVGAAQPVVATITDDDLVVGEPVRWQKYRSMSELVNSIQGTHPDPEQLWSMVGYESIVLDDAIVVDRRTRDVPMDFPTVRSPRQAKQLASIYAAENRLEATADITVRPRWQVLKAGDWITWNSARYGTKTYIVVSRVLKSLDSDKPRVAVLSLQERNAGIYDGVQNPVPIVPYPPGKPVYLQEVANFQLAAVLAGTADKLMPAIRAQWDPIDDVTVVGVDLEWWPTAQPAAKGSLRVSDDVSSAVLVEGVVSDTEYSVRTRLVTSPQRVVAWSDPETITTPDQPYTDIAVYLASLQEDMRNFFKDRWAEADRYFDRVSNLAANVAAANAEDIVERRRHEKAVANAATSVTRETILRAEQDEALAQEVLVVQAKVDNNAAAIVQESTARADADSALAQDITAVQAIADAGTAQGLMKWEAVAAPGGVSARFSLQGKATAGGTFRTGGAYLDVLPDSARWVFEADQFIITDGTVNGSPFVYAGSVLKVQNVVLGTLTFDQLQSSNGKLVLKGSGANASLEIFN